MWTSDTGLIRVVIVELRQRSIFPSLSREKPIRRQIQTQRRFHYFASHYYTPEWFTPPPIWCWRKSIASLDLYIFRRLNYFLGVTFFITFIDMQWQVDWVDLLQWKPSDDHQYLTIWRIFQKCHNHIACNVEELCRLWRYLLQYGKGRTSWSFAVDHPTVATCNVHC